MLPPLQEGFPAADGNFRADYGLCAGAGQHCGGQDQVAHGTALKGDTMNILITNDDGINAPGISLLAEAATSTLNINFAFREDNEDFDEKIPYLKYE